MVGRPSSPRASSAALATEHVVPVNRPTRRGASSPIRRAVHEAGFDRSARHGHRLAVEPRLDGVHELHLEHSGVTPHRAKRDAIDGRREQDGRHQLTAASILSPSDNEHSRLKRARLAERTKLFLKGNRLGSSVRARDPQALDGGEPAARELCGEQGQPEDYPRPLQVSSHHPESWAPSPSVQRGEVQSHGIHHGDRLAVEHCRREHETAKNRQKLGIRGVTQGMGDALPDHESFL